MWQIRADTVLNNRQQKMEVLLPEAGMIETKMKQDSE
jgi:hypothetical protein